MTSKAFTALFNEVSAEVEKKLRQMPEYKNGSPYTKRRAKADEITRRALKRIWLDSAMLDRTLDPL